MSVTLAPAAVAAPSHDLTSVVSDDPVDFTPHVTSGGTVRSFAEVGDVVVAGGTFTQVSQSGTDFARENIVAWNRTTGEILTSFAPRLNGGVSDVIRVPGEEAVIVTGFFTEVDGVEQRYLTKLELDGSIATGFSARADRPIWGAAIAGTTVYVGGQFNGLTGLARKRFGAFDVRTGETLTTVNFDFSGTRVTGSGQGIKYINSVDVSPDGARVIAAGNFERVDGLERNQLVVLDTAASPAVVADWGTSRYAPACPNKDLYPDNLRNVDVAPDGSYFVVVTTGGYGAPPSLCDTAARFNLYDTGESIQPHWVTYTGGDTLTDVEVSTEAVYTGGHNRWMNNPDAGDRKRAGAVDRPGLAALDPVNGIPLTWNPGRELGYGVSGFEASPDGLYIGHDTFFVADEYRNKIALFPPGFGDVPRPAPGSLPGTVRVYRDNGTVAQIDFDGTTATQLADAADDSRLDEGGLIAAMRLGERLYTFESDRNFYRYDDGADTRELVDLNALNTDLFFNDSKVYSRWRIEEVRDLTFDPVRGRIWYTMQGDSGLYWRGFTAESGIIGSQSFRFTNASEFGFNNVDGLFLDRDALYVARPTGTLDRITIRNGVPLGGSTTRVSGPGIDGIDWRGRAATILTDDATTTPNLSPTAAFDTTCTGGDGEVCVFDANRSVDPDGTITAYGWTIDGVAAGTGATLDRTFTDEADHVVVLTVTDDRGATGTAQETIAIRLAPTAEATATCTDLECDFDASASRDGADAVVSATWDFGDGASGSGIVTSHTYAVEGNYTATVIVTDDEGQTSSTDVAVSVIGPDGPIAFVAADNVNFWSTRPTVTVPQNVLPGDTLLLFATIAERDLVEGDPTGGDWQLLGIRQSGDSESHVWWKIADVDDAGTEVRVDIASPGRRVDLTIAAYKDASPVAPIAVWAADAESVLRTDHTTPQIQTDNPAFIVSYWGIKGSDQTDFVPPAGQTTRVESIGRDQRYASALLTDYGSSRPAGIHGGLVATMDTASRKGSMWTIALTKVDTSDRIGFRSAADSTNLWTSAPAVTVPQTVEPGDVMMLLASANRLGVLAATPSDSSGWTELSTFGDDAETRVWWKVATAADVGSRVTVALSRSTKVNLSLVAYKNVDTANPFVHHASLNEETRGGAHTTPALTSAEEGMVVSLWVDKSVSTSDWEEPVGEVVRVESIEFGDGHMGVLLTDNGVPSPAGQVGGLTATANSETQSGHMATFVLRQN